ncbi:MAG: nucleotidyltransferase domain-containing protein [Alphaproteobacteria bacterium]|nr:nucleotidyltransferase domain-containing protein [Alphaproteobacteria bacterium]
MIESITQHLMQIYSPHAILLHGSRARGDAVTTSDYDLVIILDNPVTAQPHIFKGCALDICGLFPDIHVLKTGNTPIWPIQLLYDHEKMWGECIMAETKRVFDAGPEALLEHEWTNRFNYTTRLMSRLLSRGDDLMIRNYYLGDFYERMIRYWFEKKCVWTMSIYKALPHIEAADPVFYAHLKGLWADNFRNECKRLFDMIFAKRI